MDLVVFAYLLGSFQILLGITRMAPRATQVSSSDNAGAAWGAHEKSTRTEPDVWEMPLSGSELALVSQQSGNT